MDLDCGSEIFKFRKISTNHFDNILKLGYKLLKKIVTLTVAIKILNTTEYSNNSKHGNPKTNHSIIEKKTAGN
jgi:hypothetical protein